MDDPNSGVPVETRRWWSGKSAAVRIACLLAVALAAVNASAESLPRVLLVAADPHTAPSFTTLELEMRRVVAASVHEPVHFDVEHLDSVFTFSPELRTRFVELFATKYEIARPDVVVAIGASALQFVLSERNRLFPGVPILFSHVDRSDLPSIALPKDAAGVVTQWQAAKQAEVALKLLPGTRRLVVILGSGPVERTYEATLRRDFDPVSKRVATEWWVGIPVPELEQRLARLPADSAVIFTTLYRDDSGGTYVPRLALNNLAERSNAPIFAAASHWIGTGIVGDGRFSYENLGAQTGELIVRVLRGESASSIGVVAGRLGPSTFDGRQLERWNIPRDRLPAGSQVKFERPSVWQQYRQQLLIGLILIVAQGLMLASIFSYRVWRRRAERAERASSESRELYMAVSDSLEERLATIARDGTIVSTNRAWDEFARSHGLDGRLGVGQNYLHRIRASVEAGRHDALRTLEAFEAVVTGRERRRRLEYRSPGGVDRWLYEMQIVALRSESGGVLVALKDITDQAQSEERVRVALESLPYATILCDADGKIELANAEAERLFGYPRPELLGRNLERLMPDFRKVKPHTAGHGTNGSVEALTARRSDGSDFPVTLHLRTISLSSRAVYLASIQDLTHTRQQEAALRRLRDETAHFGRVAMVGEMSAAIAHELNQPLTGIMANCQAAQRLIERGAMTDGDVTETLSDVVADTQRASEVIQRLRLMLLKQPADYRAINLNEIVKQVQRLVAHDLSLAGCVLDLELTEDLPPVTGDRVHLQQVVLNLILNAADAMSDVPAETRRIVLRTRLGLGHTVQLELRDRGPGIAPEVLPRLFEPFFTTKKNGMGMGLSIVRSIVETHSGQITCANAASGGAVFNIVLPSAQGAAA